jgi:hypothetical protein
VRRVSRGGFPDGLSNALDLELFEEIWADELHQGDPYHNPNFGMSAGGYRLNVAVSH